MSSTPTTTRASPVCVGSLVEQRLLVADEGSVELVHEALLEQWPRLVGWIEESAQARRLHRHLTQAALEWEESERDPSELYSGAAPCGRPRVGRRRGRGRRPEPARARVPGGEPDRVCTCNPAAPQPACGRRGAAACGSGRRACRPARARHRPPSGDRGDRAAPRSAGARRASARPVAPAGARGSQPRRLSRHAQQSPCSAPAQPGGAGRAARRRGARSR